jgi:hypothetical protein
VPESLLNPGEEPSAKLYVALAEQYPTKFAWETRQAKATKEEQRADFELFVRQNNLSSVDANFNLFQQGASIENFAGASQAEKAAYAEQAALQRNKWLRTEASPLELKVEKRYETQTQVAASQQAQADASLRAQKQRDQYAGYKRLPAPIDRKALNKFQLNCLLREASCPIVRASGLLWCVVCAFWFRAGVAATRPRQRRQRCKASASRRRVPRSSRGASEWRRHQGRRCDQ